MESDDEDPFCYKSLKRIKRSQDQADLCRAKSKSATKQISNGKRKFEVNSSKKTPKEDRGSKRVMQGKNETETLCSDEDHEDLTLKNRHQIKCTIVDACESSGHLRSKHANQSSNIVNNCTTKQQKLWSPEIVLEGSGNEEATNNCTITCTDRTNEPTQKHSPNSSKGNTNSSNISSFQIQTQEFSSPISHISLKQDSNVQFQTDQLEKLPQISDLIEDKMLRKGSEKSYVRKLGRKESEEGRCPFCQMPFRALSGQSPNWHTMECMDVPLKTGQECPAGLTCDNTVPSHYRRYAHSLLALHFAGQNQDSSCISVHSREPVKHSNANQETPLPLPTTGSESKRTLPMEKKTPPKTSRSRKRKQSPSKPGSSQSASGIGSSQPLSQSSQNSSGSSSSIKAYFSPMKKTDHSPGNSKGRVSEIEFDPVLRLLVTSDSDSDDTVEKIRVGAEIQNETHEEKMDCDIQVSEEVSCLQKSRHNGESVCDLGNIAKEDFGCGFLVQGDEEFATNNIDDDDETLTEKPVDSNTHSLASVPVDSNSNTHSLASVDNKTEFQQVCPSALTSTIRTTATAPCGLQKQTSLFSFFKPQCHSASGSKQTGSREGTPVKPKSSLTNRGGEKKGGWQEDRKPTLTKTASEPVKMIRIPSPPRNDVSLTNGRQQRSGGNKSAVHVSSSFKNSSGRQCPFYKRLPGTAITVDAFSYGEIPGCQAYVLTHFHYDHYQGLTKRFSQPLFCSQVTGNLVEKQIGVHKKWINRLPLNEPCQIAGVWATLMEANHCPGAVIILFELPNGKKLLHTGDFRADACMEEYPPLVSVGVDELYLDTTYCDPAHTFPSQKEVIDFAVSTALKAVAKEPSIMIVCGAYTIGKERIFIALAEALQSKVCVQSAKKRVLDCLEDARLKSRVSLKWGDGCVHVLPMRQLNAQGLGQHLQQCPQFSSILAFEPTGWTHSNKTLSLEHLRPKFSGRGITIYGVPYSEHSSYLEMKRFVQFLRPKKILPTVNNGNPTSRRKMEAIFKQWLSERLPQTQQGSANAATQRSLGAWLAR